MEVSARGRLHEMDSALVRSSGEGFFYSAVLIAQGNLECSTFSP